jgi:hypothetical protein
VRLDLCDYHPGIGWLRLRGLYGAERKKLLLIGTLDALDGWIWVRGTLPGPLFLAINSGGKIQPQLERMTTQAFYKLEDRLLSQGIVRSYKQ